MFSVCTAIPLKKDDTPQLKAEGEKFASDKLQEFKAAASQSSDPQNLKEFFNDLLVYVQKAQKNNEKLTKGIGFIVKRMKAITANGISLRNRAGHRLHVLTTLVDGNRDNVSYYVLDYASQWIEKRLESVSGELKSIMSDIRDDIVTARDRLDNNAQVFVKGVKDIMGWTTFMQGPNNASKIMDVIANLEKGANDKTLVSKTNEAVSKLQSLIV